MKEKQKLEVIRVTPEAHKALKIEAVKQDKQMTELASELIMKTYG